jgi:hypothetical protein
VRKGQVRMPEGPKGPQVNQHVFAFEAKAYCSVHNSIPVGADGKAPWSQAPSKHRTNYPRALTV